MLGASIYNPVEKKSYYIENAQGIVTYLNRFPDAEWTGHNVKYDAIVLQRHFPFLKHRFTYDTMLAWYLLHQEQSRKLENIVKDKFKFHKPDLIEIYNKYSGFKVKRKNLPSDWSTKIPKEVTADYAKADVEWTSRVEELSLQDFAKRPELKAWFDKVEMPVAKILIESELDGVKIDREKLTIFKDKLVKKIAELEGTLKFIAGEGKDFNLNSSQQIAKVLFKKFKLKAPYSTESGKPSTDVDTLELLANEHAFPKLLLDYRKLNKLFTTYTDPILEQLDSKDRIHTTFNQALTHTRRFSSEHPNLQNIPSRTELGKEMRHCFVPAKGKKFLIADYNQIELRLLAHFSGDPMMKKWFTTEGVDFHQQTADLISKQLGQTFSRDNGKTLNFSIIYGKTAWGFSKDWNCKEQEAQKVIDAYFQQFSEVGKWMERVKGDLYKTKGFATSLCGLPIYVGDIFTESKAEEQYIQRCAVNYPIQGSSQDVLKLGITNVYSSNRWYPILMVHDEVVYEIPEETPEQEIKKVIHILENSCSKLTVPMKVNWKVDKVWSK